MCRVRCFGYPTNLDANEGGLRAREVVDILCEEVDPGTLWDEWGVISELVVRHYYNILVLFELRFFQPFTNDFPRADIHILIAPDILHQIIKGTFKDHLVTWVEQYLELQHGKTRAKEILDDIDRR